jgi:predicted PurR-regulated permease PerM
MLNTYLRLVLLVAAILIVLAILHFVIPLLVMAAVAAALILGVVFLINLFRRRGSMPRTPGAGP